MTDEKKTPVLNEEVKQVLETTIVSGINNASNDMKEDVKNLQTALGNIQNTLNNSEDFKLLNDKINNIQSAILDIEKKSVPSYFNPTSNMIIGHKKSTGTDAFTAFVKAITESAFTNTPRKIVAERLLDSVKSEAFERVRDEIKNMQIGDVATGGALVPPDFVNEVIPFLQKASVMMSMGMRALPSSSGVVEIPSIDAIGSGSWVAEGATMDTMTPTTGKHVVSTKEYKLSVAVSNSLLSANDSINQILNDLLIGQMAVDIDTKLIRGLGSENSVKGLKGWINSSNVFNSAGYTAANVRNDLYKAIEKVESNNVNIGAGGWLMSTRTKAFLRQLLNSLNLPIYADEILQGTLEGYKLGVTNIIPNNLVSTYSEIYFADFSKCYLVEKGQMTMNIIPYGTYEVSGVAKSGLTRNETVFMIDRQVGFGMMYDTAGALIEQIAYIP